MAEGIIFKGFLLSRDEFIQIVKTEIGQSIMTDLQKDITNLLELDFKNANLIFNQWNEIQKKYFFPTTILGVSIEMPDESNKTYTFSTSVAESETLGGNDIVFKKIMAIKMSEEAQDILNKHYMQMLAEINSSTFSKEEAQYFHIYLWYQFQKVTSYSKLAKTAIQKTRNDRAINSAKTRYKEHYTNQPYNKIYGALPGFSKEGKQLDAFMNHMGAHHANLFNNSSTIASSVLPSLLNLSKSVGTEEGSHFFYLLLESLNTTPWYAGGDIVVVDETGQVIYNIQLKSSARSNARFKIRTNQLYRQLLQIQNAYLSTNLEKAANIIYDALKIETANDPGPREEDYIDQLLSKLGNLT